MERRRYAITTVASILVGSLLAVLLPHRTRGLPAAHQGDDITDSARASESPRRAEATRVGSTERSPPRFVPQRPEKAVENDPLGVGYDPISIFEIDGLPLRVLYRAEPKDPTWAPVMEERLADIVRRDVDSLGATAKIKAVECRKMSCNIVVTAETAADLSKGLMLLNYTPLGNLQAVERPLGDPAAAFSSGYVIAWHPDERSLAVQNRVYPAMRQRRLAELRQKKLPERYPPVPAE